MNRSQEYEPFEMCTLVDDIEETLLDIHDSMRQLKNAAHHMQIIMHMTEEVLLVASALKELSVQATRWEWLASGLTDTIHTYSETLARDLEKEDNTL